MPSLVWKVSTSGLHVRITRPEDLVRPHAEVLHLLAHAEDLIELPEIQPADFLLQSFLDLRGQVTTLLGVERLLVLFDQLLELAGRVEVAEGAVARQEALREIRRIPRAVDERVVAGVLQQPAPGSPVVLPHSSVCSDTRTPIFSQ